MTPEWKNILFDNSEEHVQRVNRFLAFHFRESRNLRRSNSELKTKIESLKTRIVLLKSQIIEAKRRQLDFCKSLSELEQLTQNLNLEP